MRAWGGGGEGDFSDLQLQLPTDAEETVVNESWAVSEEGTLRHRATGIHISERGLQDGKNVLDSINPEDIEVDQTALLGRGAGGIVARGVYRPDGQILAVKVVRVEDKAKKDQLINELHNLLRIAKSPFLIQIYQAYVNKDSGCVHVALEFMDYGSLADVKLKVATVPENILALIMIQILEGLKVLHLSYVVHRDVKLGNILVNSRGFVKVTDFGISKRLGDAAFCDTFVGTATHMSPERVMGDDYSFAADIWGLGLCVIELATGTYPYGSIASFPVLFDKLCNKAEPRLSPTCFSANLCDFVERQLQRQPQSRATAVQLQAHVYIMANLFQVSQGELISWLNSMMQETRPSGTASGRGGGGLLRSGNGTPSTCEPSPLARQREAPGSSASSCTTQSSGRRITARS